MALSSASGSYPSTARQNSMSIWSGLAATAS